MNDQIKQAFSELKAAGNDWKDSIKKAEAAERLRVSQRTVDNLAKRGELTKFSVGGGVRFSANQVNSLLFNPKPVAAKPQAAKTTFIHFSNDKKKAPVIPNQVNSDINISYPQTEVTLSAIGSYDPTVPTGEIKTFKWERLSGGPQLGMIETADKQSTLFKSLVVGDYKVKLTVTGSTGITTEKIINIKVNLKPTPKPSDPAGEPDPGASVSACGFNGKARTLKEQIEQNKNKSTLTDSTVSFKGIGKLTLEDQLKRQKENAKANDKLKAIKDLFKRSK